MTNMRYGLAYSFNCDGVLGVLVDVFFIGMAYLMSLVFRMVYLLHEMEHLIFGMNYLVISSQK